MMNSIASPAQFEAFEKTNGLPNYFTSAADVDAVAPLVVKSDPKAVGEWMSEDLNSDTRPGLKSITVPVLEIAPYDKSFEAAFFATPAGKQAYYASLLAGDSSAKVATIEPSRHFIMYDRPQQLDAAIAAFLQGLP